MYIQSYLCDKLNKFANQLLSINAIFSIGTVYNKRNSPTCHVEFKIYEGLMFNTEESLLSNINNLP